MFPVGDEDDADDKGDNTAGEDDVGQFGEQEALCFPAIVGCETRLAKPKSVFFLEKIRNISLL
ncbi:hypothetical protein DPMN_075362 [Dreissena polymorpha]|uniref:Uncharacterized protein n=1 Tax=Dreissena polymorpha TaxID=45954 RepID=A0A9D3YHZ1_DREPO|nr:hypothetical protein DPMN_075362 [Dreissena polymorpha]